MVRCATTGKTWRVRVNMHLELPILYDQILGYRIVCHARIFVGEDAGVEPAHGTVPGDGLGRLHTLCRAGLVAPESKERFLIARAQAPDRAAVKTQGTIG